MKFCIIQSSGDIGSAIAHQLAKRDINTLITDHQFPAHSRRGMCFVDAYFENVSELDGSFAYYQSDFSQFGTNKIIVCCNDVESLLNKFEPFVVIDARMRKRDIPERPIWKDRHHAILIGLGPGFIKGINCDVAIETSWGESLGTEVMGATKDLEGDPRPIEGLTRERIVYAKNSGQWRTTFDLAQKVQAGEVIGTISDEIVKAPISGLLRGISHHLAEVKVGQKVIEIDPSQKAQIYGLGERPLRISKGVIEALAKRGLLNDHFSI